MLNDQDTIKIQIYGEAGQGIQYLAKTLAEIFNKLGYEYIAVNYDYDAVVRTGKSDSDVIVSHKKITSPIVDVADICVITRPEDSPIESKLYIVEEEIFDKVKLPNTDSIPTNTPVDTLNPNTLNVPTANVSVLKFPFAKVSKESEASTPINMLILGKILGVTGISYESVESILLELFTGEKGVNNLQAINRGFDPNLNNSFQNLQSLSPNP